MADRLFFISYKSEQYSQALKTKDFVEEQGFLGWLDNSGGLVAGDAWKEMIDNAIQESISLIVLVSAESMQSPYVTYEWSYAMGLGKRVIPVFLQDPDKPPLKYLDGNGNTRELVHPKLHPQHLQHVAMWDENHQQWDKLAEVIKSVFEEVKVPLIVQTMRNTLFANIFNSKERREIFHVLKDYEHKATTDLLIQLFDLPYNIVVAEAGIALAQKSKYTDERAYKPLEVGLKLSDTSIQALECLAKYNSPEAVKILVERYKDHKKGNLGASSDQVLDTLSTMKAQEVEFELIKLFREGHRSNSLSNALIKLQSSEIIPYLISNLKEKYRDVYDPFCIKTLGGIRSENSIRVLGEIVDTLKSEDSDTISQSNLQAFELAVEGLANIGGRQALDILEDARDWELSQTECDYLLDEAIKQVKSNLDFY
ncbi:TIR domain-containing protein [Phototrophicus methaneseepsis]|uniref:TIR domain-containing protein n=1 Tax=Phototrophicus methaneseepsis TaxID=2710758 RepID=A0A7S8E9L1_9CHLR|nr:TIR domain-containing protein [Phototrophicus methaneseepsis]QPC82897.1 TIR domain-containing protein [Phototrophicus methaneseepsis]